MKDYLEQQLNNAISSVIINFSTFKAIEGIEGKTYISGKFKYQHTITNCFETTLVDSLFRELLKNSDKIGWECTYPENTIFKNWSKCKLDLGLGIVSEDPNEYRFTLAVEVKVCNVKSQIYGVYSDGYKLLGYCDKSMRKIGKEKYVLVFAGNECAKADFDFITSIKEGIHAGKHNQAKDFLKKKAGWKEEDFQAVKDKYGAEWSKINVPQIFCSKSIECISPPRRDDRIKAYLLKVDPSCLK